MSSKLPSIQASKPPSFQASKLPSNQASKPPSLQASKLPSLDRPKQIRRPRVPDSNSNPPTIGRPVGRSARQPAGRSATSRSVGWHVGRPPIHRPTDLCGHLFFCKRKHATPVTPAEASAGSSLEAKGNLEACGENCSGAAGQRPLLCWPEAARASCLSNWRRRHKVARVIQINSGKLAQGIWGV